MILHIPEIIKKDGLITVAARVETRAPVPNLPKDLWFRFPERYAATLPVRADGFAATGLLTAMVCGEDLDLRAPISPKLAYHLLEYRNIFHIWLPKIFQMVDVRYEKVEIEAEGSKARGVGSAFSGGVDSFFTLWSHLAKNQPIVEARITHGLFLHGFDLRLDEEAPYKAIAKKYATLFNEYGLELISASTNAYQFAEFRVDWGYFFGAPLIGAATFLSPFFERFYIPSGLSYQELEPQGSSALVDHLLSTEQMSIVHHGASTSRLEKIQTLTEWPVTYNLLRVCSKKNQSAEIRNCSSCHKCYRAMAVLTLLDASSKYSTFASKLSPWDYLRWGMQTHMNIYRVAEIRKRAWKSGKIGLALGIWTASSIHIFVEMAIKTIKFFLPAKTLYQIKRKFFKPESNEAVNPP